MQTIEKICSRNCSPNTSIINLEKLMQLSVNLSNVKFQTEDIKIEFYNDIYLSDINIITYKHDDNDIFNLYIPNLYKGKKKLFLYLYFYFKPNGKYGLSGLFNSNHILNQALITEKFRNKYNIKNSINKPYFVFTYKSLKIINSVCYIDEINERKLTNKELVFDTVVDFQEKYPRHFIEAVYYTKKANKDTLYFISEGSKNFRILSGIFANLKNIDKTEDILIKNDFTKLPSINISGKVRINNDIYIRGYDFIVSSKKLD